MKKLEIKISCPECERKFTQRVEKMRPGRSRKCPFCGTTIEFTGDDLSKAQKALDDLEKTMKDFGNIEI